MRKVRVLFWMLLFSSVCWSGVFDRGTIGDGKEEEKRAIAAERLIAAARKDLGIREATGRNDGTRIQQYLAYVGFKEAAPYCAAAISYWFHEAGYKEPRTAWSPAMFPKERVVGLSGWYPSSRTAGRDLLSKHGSKDFSASLEMTKMLGLKKGLVLGIYFPSLKRIGHVGLVESVDGDMVKTIEANTNVAGSREGDGVYRKIRHKRTIYKYADWL